ncbi:MAG: SDR family NAD(P)-dependent oxidoreductase [Gammaproteobacteria bacterium]|nr:SDR family NAD(P)-dependent oxidoreductase [Gammaproteobacteria bacterium]
MGRLTNRIAWVTGGGRGIGRAIALEFARDGADVAVSSRTMAELESVAAEIGEHGVRAHPVVCDAMSFEDIRGAVAQIEEALGPIDILVNNAGGGVAVEEGDLSAAEHDDRSFVANVDLNLFSAYRATQAVLSGMTDRGYGRVINIGSGYAKRSGGGVAYTAAKHGMIGMTRAMAAEVGRTGVTINCLCPGWTNTQLVNLEAMAARGNTDVDTVRKRIASENLQRRILEPDELGPMAALLAAPQSNGITGQVISVDGGYKV